ncbi:MAG: DUF1905 domain-containing protein [Flavobacteriales bacterium]|nr:DUF1905 domain-containing protein [Flavobacteriales bacterium]
MGPTKKGERYHFTAPLQRLTGEYTWYFIEFPFDVQEQFGTKGRVRVKTLMNGHPFDRALMPQKSGVHILILGGDIRRQTKVRRVGDRVEVELWKDPEPDKVTLPEALEETLEFMPEFGAFWSKLKPGMQRSMAYWVGSAKTEATQAKRIAELLRRFEEDDWHFGGRRIRT